MLPSTDVLSFRMPSAPLADLMLLHRLYHFITICTHDRRCILSQITVGALKRLVNRKLGHDIWQRSFHEHVIRNAQDYREIWEYIDANPAKWAEDRYFPV